MRMPAEALRKGVCPRNEELLLNQETNPDQFIHEIPALEDIYKNPTNGIFTNSSYDDEGVVADFTNLEPVVNVSPIPTSRINSINPSTLILEDPQSAVQTRSKHCLFACFLSQNEPKKISKALEDESWVDAMQEEVLNKKDERGVVVRNKARLVAQGHRQEEGIHYDEVFTPVARIEAIRIFLAFASYMGFIVYQMDVKSAFLYGKIDEQVYVSQPLGFIDHKCPEKVYKVVKALYGLHQAPKAWYLKGKPKMGLWYPRVSSFDLEAYSDSVSVRGSSPRWQTRQYEVLFRWRLDQSERDTWHWRVSVRGVRVSVRGQACMDPCQSLAIMRRLVECKKSIIPLDPAISLDEDLKGRNCPSHLEAINGARISWN
ncbi:putative ribonuclease H-like domain-containing protein [Tanacetum coccineum]